MKKYFEHILILSIFATVKLLTTYFLAGLLTVVYAISTTGVGIYQCHCGYSNWIALLTSGDCDCRHEQVQLADCTTHQGQEHDDCCGTAECEAQDSENQCCQVIYQVLKLDQESTSMQMASEDYSKHITLQPIALPVLVPEYHFLEGHRLVPPPLLHVGKLSSIYRHAQLRL